MGRSQVPLFSLCPQTIHPTLPRCRYAEHCHPTSIRPPFYSSSSSSGWLTIVSLTAQSQSPTFDDQNGDGDHCEVPGFPFGSQSFSLSSTHRFCCRKFTNDYYEINYVPGKITVGFVGENWLKKVMNLPAAIVRILRRSAWSLALSAEPRDIAHQSPPSPSFG